MTKKFLSIAMCGITLATLLTSCGTEQTASHIHSYGEWVTIAEADCTINGRQERYCACGDIQTQSIPKTDHTYDEWEITKEATCGQAGEKRAICLKCNLESTITFQSSRDHNFGDGVVTEKATCTETGKESFTCKVCNYTRVVSIPALGHKPNSSGKCSTCGYTTLNMTSSEIANAEKIEKMSHSVSEYSDEIRINVTLKDENSYALQVPVYVKVEINDDNGNVLYSETLIKKSSQDKISIAYEDVKCGETNIGTLYYTVYNDYCSFEKISHELEKIPWTVDVSLPKLPLTVSYYDDSSCKITSIRYEVNDDDITFYFTGEKIYDKKGKKYSDECRIGWKLYDADGYVIDDGTCYTSSITMGEKFRDADDCAYGVIEQGGSYRLVILDIA